MGAKVVAWTSDEGVSGTLKAEDRPGLTEALVLIRDGKADGLIVRDLDRLARKVTVQEAVLGEVWQRDDAAVYTASPAAEEVLRDDPDDPWRTGMREIAASIRGIERGLIAKRLRDGRKAKAANGGHSTGSPPYGWRTDEPNAANPHSALVADPAEQAALARMKAMAAQGVSTREIARVLTAEGHPTKRGGQWSSPTVARILHRLNREGIAV